MKFPNLPTVKALGAGRALTRMRQWLLPSQRAPQIPEVANMLVIRESVWQRGERMVLTRAFGVATVAYMVCAWVVVGVATSPPPTDGSTAHIDSRTAVAGATSSSGRPERPYGDAPAVHIDPHSFATLQKTLSELDSGADGGQLTYQQPEVDGPTQHLAGQAGLGPLDPLVLPEASALALPPEVVASPSGPSTEAPALTTPAPETSAVAPPPEVVANPSGPTAGAPASTTPVPETSAVAPPPEVVANPNGQPADAIVQQPLGPLPGPA